MLGLSSAMICSLHNGIHPPEMDTILWRWCVAAYVVRQQKTVTHAALSPNAVHLSMYNCIYWVTLRVFISGDPQSIYTRWPSEYSAGECYNHPLFHQLYPLPSTTPSSINYTPFHQQPPLPSTIPPSINNPLFHQLYPLPSTTPSSINDTPFHQQPPLPSTIPPPINNPLFHQRYPLPSTTPSSITDTPFHQQPPRPSRSTAVHTNWPLLDLHRGFVWKPSQSRTSHVSSMNCKATQWKYLSALWSRENLCR